MGCRRRGPVPRQPAVPRRCRRWPSRVAYVSSSMFSCLAAWVIWPAIASAWSCAWRPSVSASSAVNFLPLASSSRRRAAKSSSLLSDWPVCRPAQFASAISASRRVDQLRGRRGCRRCPAGARRRRTTSRSPCHRPRSVSLPRLEVLRHRRGHHDQRGQRVLLVRGPLLRGASSSLACLWNSLDRDDVEARLGQRLAERDLAVAIDVGLRRPLRLRPVEQTLGEEDRLPAASTSSRPRSDRERTAVSGSEASLPASMITS